MTLSISKRIPARTVTYRAAWCGEFQEMTQEFRKIRSRSRNPMTSCFVCRKPILDGEMMFLAAFEKKGNRTLCKDCGEELLTSGDPE